MNRLKKKSHMIILIDAVKEFDKIQHPFMIFKTLRKLGLEENFLYSINSIYKDLWLTLYFKVK